MLTACAVQFAKSKYEVRCCVLTAADVHVMVLMRDVLWQVQPCRCVLDVGWSVSQTIAARRRYCKL
jgi:hypothetical protein